MPIKVDIIKPASLVMTDLYGFVTFDERLEALDQILFAIRHFNVRHGVMDLSMMNAQNREADELFFAEKVVSKAYILTLAHQSIIHSPEFGATIILAKFMIREGIRVTEFNIDDSQLSAIPLGR